MLGSLWTFTLFSALSKVGVVVLTHPHSFSSRSAHHLMLSWLCNILLAVIALHGYQRLSLLAFYLHRATRATSLVQVAETCAFGADGHKFNPYLGPVSVWVQPLLIAAVSYSSHSGSRRLFQLKISWLQVPETFQIPLGRSQRQEICRWSQSVSFLVSWTPCKLRILMFSPARWVFNCLMEHSVNSQGYRCGT